MTAAKIGVLVTGAIMIGAALLHLDRAITFWMLLCGAGWVTIAVSQEWMVSNAQAHDLEAMIRRVEHDLVNNVPSSDTVADLSVRTADLYRRVGQLESNFNLAKSVKGKP